MTNARLEESLGRLSALKRFPANPFALTAIAETLRELCPTDDDAAGLVREVLCNFDEWCGPLALRKCRGQIIERDNSAERKRIQKEQYAAAIQHREVHEAGCGGYQVHINDQNQTVEVVFCREVFGDFYRGVYCRRGDELRARDADSCICKQAEELADRPGWMSEEEYWNRQVSRKRAQLVACADTGKPTVAEMR